MTETDGFDEIVGGIAAEFEDRALVTLAASAIKAAHVSSVVFKEAKEAGIPEELAMGMAGDVWKIIMMPFVIHTENVENE